MEIKLALGFQQATGVAHGVAKFEPPHFSSFGHKSNSSLLNQQIGHQSFLFFTRCQTLSPKYKLETIETLFWSQKLQSYKCFFCMYIFLHVLIYRHRNINLLISFAEGLDASNQDHAGTAFSLLFKHRIKILIGPTEAPKKWLLLLHNHFSSAVPFVLQTTLFNQGVVQTARKIHYFLRRDAICALYCNLIPDTNGSITLTAFGTDSVCQAWINIHFNVPFGIVQL